MFTLPYESVCSPTMVLELAVALSSLPLKLPMEQKNHTASAPCASLTNLAGVTLSSFQNEPGSTYWSCASPLHCLNTLLAAGSSGCLEICDSLE
jgi:hypothetical protein